MPRNPCRLRRSPSRPSGGRASTAVSPRGCCSLLGGAADSRCRNSRAWRRRRTEASHLGSFWSSGARDLLIMHVARLAGKTSPLGFFCSGCQQNCIDFLAGSFFSPEPNIRVEEYISELFEKKNLKGGRCVLQHLHGPF